MYTINVLTNEEFDGLDEGVTRGSDISNSLGFADPRTQQAYVRFTEVPELNKYLIEHELEELAASSSTHEDEYGIRHKNYGSMFSGAANAVGKGASAVGRGASAVGRGAASAGRAVGSGVASAGRAIGTGAQNLYGGAKSALGSAYGGLQNAGSSIMDMFGGGSGDIASTMSQTGQYTPKISQVGKYSDLIGSGVGTNAGQFAQQAMASTPNVSSVGGLQGGGLSNFKPAPVQPQAGPTAAPYTQTAKPVSFSGSTPQTSQMGQLGQAAQTSPVAQAAQATNQSVVPSMQAAQGTPSLSQQAALQGNLQGTQTPSPGLMQKVGNFLSSSFTKQDGQDQSSAMGMFNQAQPLMGAAALKMGLDKQYPEVPDMSGITDPLQSQIQGGGSPLGQEAQGKLSEMMGQEFAPMDEAEIQAATAQIDREQQQAEDQLADYYRNIRPGSDPVTDSAYAKDLADLKQRFAESKSNIVATRTRDLQQNFDSQRMGQIQTSIGASNQEMQQLMQVAQLDIGQIMAQLNLDIQQAQTFKETFINLGSTMIAPTINPQTALLQQMMGR